MNNWIKIYLDVMPFSAVKQYLAFTEAINYKGPSMKEVRTKSRKIDPLPHCPHWLNVAWLCDHTINFEKFEVFCIKKCGLKNLPLSASAKCPHWTNPSPSYCGRLSWTAPYWIRFEIDRLNYWCTFLFYESISTRDLIILVKSKVQKNSEAGSRTSYYTGFLVYGRLEFKFQTNQVWLEFKRYFTTTTILQYLRKFT